MGCCGETRRPLETLDFKTEAIIFTVTVYRHDTKSIYKNKFHFKDPDRSLRNELPPLSGVCKGQ